MDERAPESERVWAEFEPHMLVLHRESSGREARKALGGTPWAFVPAAGYCLFMWWSSSSLFDLIEWISSVVTRLVGQM